MNLSRVLATHRFPLAEATSSSPRLIAAPAHHIYQQQQKHHHQLRSMTTSKPESEYTPRSTETPYHIAAEAIQLLKESNQTLSVSESLTGGRLMAALTSVEGCSAVFRGGVVSYATSVKQNLLHVDEDLISQHGVINSEVAAQMAAGGRTIVVPQTSWGIGTTGVAGPDPQDEKPVGMVYIGVASESGSKGFGPFHFPGSGEQVREATVLEALSLFRQELRKGKQHVCTMLNPRPGPWRGLPHL